jgi:hypothetical protein
VQTGRGLCAIPPGKGIDLRQKNRAKRKRLPARLFLMHFFAFKLQINHLVEQPGDVTLLKIVMNVK